MPLTKPQKPSPDNKASCETICLRRYKINKSFCMSLNSTNKSKCMMGVGKDALKCKKACQ